MREFIIDLVIEDNTDGQTSYHFRRPITAPSASAALDEASNVFKELIGNMHAAA